MTDARTRLTKIVTLDAFEIGITTVTQDDYAAVTGARPSSAVGGRLPVEGVSWWDAIEFCNTLSREVGLAPVYRRIDARQLSGPAHR